MGLKYNLTDEEKYGLTDEEIKLATRYLRAHKTRGALNEIQSAQLFELYLLGESFAKIQLQFPQYPLGQILLTASLRKWTADRDKMLHTLQDRVRAKVVKSVLDQVDFLGSMLAVATAEHHSDMLKYIQDPINNPKPALRIESIKDYQAVSDSLTKIVAGATSTKSGQNSPMFEALTNPATKRITSSKKKEEDDDDLNIIDIMEADDQAKKQV